MRLGPSLALVWASVGFVAAAFVPSSRIQLAEMNIQHLINVDSSSRYGSAAGSDVKGALAAASRATGVDFAYLTANASLESSLDPSAKAKTSSAAGLFQFIESTWGQMVERHGAKIGLEKEAAALASGDFAPGERRRIMDLRFDVGIAARLGAEFAAENADYLRDNLGREPEDVDLYLAHFLGPGGAASFLKQLEAAPTAAAAPAFPAAAKANRSVFYDGARERSFAEIRDRFTAKLAARANDVAGLPETSPRSFAPAASSAPFNAFAARAPVAAMANAGAGKPAFAGDPWFATLVNAQLTMNDSLTRATRDDAKPIAETFRGLLG